VIRKGCAAAAVILFLFTSSRDARAQPSRASTPGRVEVSFGGLWMGGQALGNADANETTGAGSAFRVFTSDSALGSGTGIEGRIAVRLLRSLEAEVSSSYATPKLTITVGNDIENAPAVTAVETIQQITVGGGALWYLPTKALARRFAPFAAGGAGYMRQVHETGTLIDAGRFVQVGGGFKYLLFGHANRHVKALGVRVDVRALLRTRGVAFDEKAHAAPALGAAAFLRF
jgi:hypothetical protein